MIPTSLYIYIYAKLIAITNEILEFPRSINRINLRACIIKTSASGCLREMQRGGPRDEIEWPPAIKE